jgi:hypothetical protein
MLPKSKQELFGGEQKSQERKSWDSHVGRCETMKSKADPQQGYSPVPKIPDRTGKLDATEWVIDKQTLRDLKRVVAISRS